MDTRVFEKKRATERERVRGLETPGGMKENKIGLSNREEEEGKC